MTIDVHMPTASLTIPIQDQADGPFNMIEVAADTMSDIDAIGFTLWQRYRTRGLLQKTRKPKTINTGAGPVKLDEFIIFNLRLQNGTIIRRRFYCAPIF